MSNRMAAVYVVIGVLAGYLISGSSARAQSSSGAPPSSVVIGADLLLQFESGTLSQNVSSMRCAVRALEGNWVKCGVPDPFDSSRGDRWVSLAYVTQITRHDK